MLESRFKRTVPRGTSAYVTGNGCGDATHIKMGDRGISRVISHAYPDTPS